MIRIYMLEMTHSNVFNGVTRCIQTLVSSLNNQPDMEALWVRIEVNGNSKGRINPGIAARLYLPFTIPMDLGTFLTSKIARKEFWYQINDYLGLCSQENESIIYHVHTLNLIELANILKELHGGRIITHLHCIPWKSLYDRNNMKYNELYSRYYNHPRSKLTSSDFIFRNYEITAYKESDAIITVTQYAKEFLYRMGVDKKKVRVIYNGIPDYLGHKARLNHNRSKKTILFVGNMNPSKGLEFLLQALKQLSSTSLQLIIVGYFPFTKREEILNKYTELNIQFAGRLSLKELADYYTSADIGVIPSIHEQCSYVAIEMMMFGLPIICSAVDGLDEMFQHNINALKVPVKTPLYERHSIDIAMLTHSIEKLINNKDLQRKISTLSRKLYVHHFSDKIMLRQTLHLYLSIY